jgi:hypothetical protein
MNSAIGGNGSEGESGCAQPLELTSSPIGVHPSLAVSRRGALTRESLEKLIKNPIFDSVSGRIGSFVVATNSKTGKISIRANSTKPRPTQGQRAQQRRFKRAAAYSNRVLADPEKRVKPSPGAMPGRL